MKTREMAQWMKVPTTKTDVQQPLGPAQWKESYELSSDLHAHTHIYTHR